MTQITYNSWSKYDLALMFTLLTLIDSRLAELETENARLVQLRDLLHASLGRYDTAYKQSTKSFLTETIDTKDTARDKLTMAIEWVARYWMKLPDEADAVRGRRVYQPFKDFDYRRDEALMAQNAKWDNIAQVYAQADLQAMGLAALVTKANALTQEIEQLMQQRQTEGASYVQGEMNAARAEAEDLLTQLMQYLNALLVVSPDAALEDCAAYMQQDFNKVDLQYQQGRKHGKGGASREQSETSFGSAEAQPALDVVKKDDDEDGGGDVTPVVPEVSE